LVDLIKVELHCHTSASLDGWPSPQALIAEAKRKGIQRLAITDHNSIAAAKEAKRMDPGLIIVGEEIKTTVGEILAYFVTNEVPRGLEPMEAIHRLKEQGAVISLSHPFDQVREHWPDKELAEILPYLDGIEIYNSRCFSQRPNQLAAQFAIKHDLPGLAGSDAHTIMEIGQATMKLMAFTNANEFRTVLNQAKIDARLSLFWVHLFSWSRGISRKLIRLLHG
jgi:predicted metal-dependent phosphoesterase TrpH